MRLLFFLFFGLCFAAPVMSQRPSAKEIEAQKQEALNDARQQLSELKKQIADAKANKEDPENIRELEKQLSTMEQMVTMLEKTFSPTGQRPQTLAPTKVLEPEYVSPFIPIVLKQPVSVPTRDQAKDQLLWYTGKKIDANTLITVTGVIVRYDRQGNRVIVQTDKRIDTPYYGLVNTLARTKQMKSQFAIGMIGMTNTFFMWPEIKKAYDEYNFFRDRYFNIAKNTIEVPAPQPNVILETWHQHLVNYMNNLPQLQNIVLPPKRPNDLCNCDPEERENFEHHLVAWLENDFWKEEQQILTYLHTIYSQGMAINANRPLPANLKPDIVRAYDLVIERSSRKLWELCKQYQEPDIYVEEGLVMAAISLQKLLMHTFSDVDEPSTLTLKRNAYDVIDRIKNLVMQNKVFEKYMKDQLAAKNYNVVFDYSLYLAHEYNKKLLSPSYRIEENFFQNWVESLRKFNRFTLNVTMDFDYRMEGKGSRVMKVTGTLEAKPVKVSLGRDSCKWHLYLSDVNHSGPNANEDSFYIPVKVVKGTKIIYRDPDPPLVFGYTGPPEMEMVFPDFQITFCNAGGSDSLFMDKLRYADKVAKAFMAANPKIDFGREFSLDMFQYSNKMFISILKTKDNMADLVTAAGNMMNMQTQVQLPKSTGNQNLDNLMMDFLMNKKRRLLQQGETPITNTGKTIFSFDAFNGASTLVSASFDTADPSDPDRQAGINLAHGIVTVKVIHTPK